MERLLTVLEKSAKSNEPLEVFHLNYAVAMDSITAYLFGPQEGTDFVNDVAEREAWLKAYASHVPYQVWNAELKGLVKVAAYLRISVVPDWISKASQWLEDWTLERCQAVEKRFSSPKPKTPDFNQPSTKETYPVVYAALHNSLPKDPSLDKHPKHLQIAATCTTTWLPGTKPQA